MKRFGYPIIRRRCCHRLPTWSELLRGELGLDERTSRIGPCFLNHSATDNREFHMLMDCDEARRLRVLVLLRSLRGKAA